MNDSKIVYSAAIHGDNIYFFGLASTILHLPERYFVVHLTQQSKDKFVDICNYYHINLDKVQFIIHENTDNRFESTYWRYETLLMDYDIVHVIDTDVDYSNLDKYYNSWYIDYPDYNWFMMHTWWPHTNIPAGLSSFRLCNIEKKIFLDLIDDMKNNVTEYRHDEIILWKHLKDYYKNNGILYTTPINDKNRNDVKVLQFKPFKYRDVDLTQSQVIRTFQCKNITYRSVNIKVNDYYLSLKFKTWINRPDRLVTQLRMYR